MSVLGDDHHEMRTHHLDDRTIEAILAGRPPAGAADLDALAGLVAEVRAVASSPVPTPGPALAAILAEGLTIEKGDLPATAASNVPGPARQAAGLPKWRGKTMVGALLAKLAELGLVAKAGVAAGALTLSASTAAATGTLPDVVQDPVADAVEQVSGLNIPGGAEDVRKDAEHRKNAEVADEHETPAAPGDTFGAQVSDMARNGELEGKEFGQWVRDNAPKAPQATERTANRPTASNNPGTTARQSAPTASNNPGTSARESAPTSQSESTPTAESNPSSDAPYTGQPESTPTEAENPGSSFRPGR